ncbi:MAG: hypothetical protein BGO01_01755 [Armatimonadetes bacterium 55-13]|nr:glycoside hydrolase family 127 protein [Armatimonadota bacterium]OJU65665.1 MAG: hypothetical protein BGO01_01755 [Armatimonadetes bacterium 55-13]
MVLLGSWVFASPSHTPMSSPTDITVLDRPPASGVNSFYQSNRAPLVSTPLVKLPITAFAPGGWLRKNLEMQRDGLAGHLGEISVWLTKQDNAWLNKDGVGKYGWEEVPYWLRGYARIAYALNDPKMLAETKIWIEGTLTSQRPNGDFGPIHNHGKGFRDLWAQMLMLQVLQSWYEYSGDNRVLPFMTRYFHWQMTIPDEQFLKDYWENSRGGDNLASVYWLYNRTGEAFLLELATKIDRNTANWRTVGHLPNWHVVNIAECFREPATYYQQSKKEGDLEASYRVFDFVREKYGQVPGGMFGADENARPGHDDPHQAAETCSMVEQIMSNAYLVGTTGDPKWIANTEDVSFNSLPAAHLADYRALRYLTAPNMVTSDSKNHAPGFANEGPFQLMNPFSSRCCQHNHTSGWVNFLESTWMATQDNGLAALVFNEGAVRAKVGIDGEVSISTKTKYPFDGAILMRVSTHKASRFPLYLLIPSWANGSSVKVGGESIKAVPGKYLRLEREWMDGDTISVNLPMKPSLKVWDQMKNSVSVNYGPLTFSLKIAEEFKKVDGTKTAQWDAGWQPGADASKWPTFEILPKSAWNFGLVQKPRFKVIHKSWPSDDVPFTLGGTPLEIETTGREIPAWGLDEFGLVGILPKSPVAVTTPSVKLELVPMGAARLRISSFPQVKD